MWRTTGWRRAMEEAAGKSNEDPRVKKRYAQAEQILAEATTPEALKGNPFRGKPLYLDRENPFDGEFAMANRVLKNAGYKPPWIEARAEILAEKEALRRAMAQHLALLERAAKRPGGESSLAALKTQHAAFLDMLKERIEKLHRQILKFNLEVPIIEQQVVNIRYETFTQEMRSAAEQLLSGERADQGEQAEQGEQA